MIRKVGHAWRRAKRDSPTDTAPRNAHLPGPGLHRHPRSVGHHAMRCAPALPAHAQREIRTAGWRRAREGSQRRQGQEQGGEARAGIMGETPALPGDDRASHACTHATARHDAASASGPNCPFTPDGPERRAPRTTLGATPAFHPDPTPGTNSTSVSCDVFRASMPAWGRRIARQQHSEGAGRPCRANHRSLHGLAESCLQRIPAGANRIGRGPQDPVNLTLPLRCMRAPCERHHGTRHERPRPMPRH